MHKFALLKNFSVLLLLLACSLQSQAAYTDNFTGGRTDFRDETIYFAMTTRFYDGDASNNTQCWDNQTANEGDPCWRGDFKGLIEKLDYIKALGFTAIWITPIVQNASGYDYHGYHAMDFSKVDTRYESEDCKFQDLIDAAHVKGMKIILDIVLNHTGNFGEENLCKLFTRDATANQATINDCMIPDKEKLGSDYLDNESTQYSRRLQWMKNTSGVNKDTHNYWHHFGNFNWDDDTRYWAQIAGDCVDLNTENPHVYNYLVKCYGEFIKMGVDGFRIDTSGHIARLTFNRAFIPQFAALGEQYKSKRLNGCPFFMYGEVCARFGGVTYRGQPALSPYFYTWQSDSKYAWNDDETSWDNIVSLEGDDTRKIHTNTIACTEEYNDNSSEGNQPTSNNVFLNGNDYHTPDYSKASGFNVIDFPVHYNFNNASQAWNMAMQGDNLYNDASFNVVYVDSHDYSPQPNDGIRFSGGTAQWAENLNLMFTFRGIPCIYYGSEIEFRAGSKIDNGPNGPLSNTGRAYFGGYIKGNITTTDFGEYTADGNAAATLNHDLAQHIIRLNKIRKAVPALRKGQYSTSGCSNNGAVCSFKRRYVGNGVDSYALVAIGGGATFSNVLNGTYTDVITGQTYNVSNGTVSVSCSGQGSMRILVKDGPGKIGEDGKFLYSSSPVSKSGQDYDGTQEEASSVNGGGNPSSGGSTNLDDLEVYEPSVTDGELCVFYEAAANVSSVAIWVWNSNTNYTGGVWNSKPNMTLMGKTSDGTRKIFKWTYTGTNSGTPTYVIFVPNNSSQTADLDYVNTGYYIDGTYNRAIGDPSIEPTTPDTPSTGETTWTFAYSGTNYSSTYAFVWDAGNNNKEYLGKWPGTLMTKNNSTGNWEITFKTSDTIKTPMVIFNNGNGNQSADWTLYNNSTYSSDGSHVTAISSVRSDATGSFTIYGLSGNKLMQTNSLNAAKSVLGKGVYVINGKKVIL